MGGFGLAAQDDLLAVQDILLVRQRCTPVWVGFDDESVADLFDAQCDQGRKPEQFARIWVHTHPGECPLPSCTDETTFARVFGECQWAVMFILAEGGQSYARLAFHAGPGGALEIPVEVDFQEPFAGSNQETWEAEYRANVEREAPLRSEPTGRDAWLSNQEQERWQDTAWDSWWEPEEEIWRDDDEAYWLEEATPYE